MKRSSPFTLPRSKAIVRLLLVVLFIALFITAGCKRGGKMIGKDYMYVSAPQANLRDRLSAVYNKVGTVKNGDRLEVLEKSKRFYRVRAEGIGEGWVEERYLADQEVYDGFAALSKENAGTPPQAWGLTRAELNMHLTAARDGEHLFQLKEGQKVEILKRAVTDKNARAIQAYNDEIQKLQQKLQAAQAAAAQPEPSAIPLRSAPVPSQLKDGVATSSKSTVPSVKPIDAKPVDIAALQARLAKLAEPPASVLEDWSLVRDSQKHVGWVLARMIDIDVPLDIAQYAEGKRIVADLIINTVTDVSDNGETRQVAQYLVLTTENKDGQPFDYNHIRVFSWNRARHRYETAYRERDLFGVFPVSVGHDIFDKEGDLPTFTVHVKDDKGQTIEKRYKMNGPMVRRVLSPEEDAAQKQALAQKLAERKTARDARIASYRAAHPQKAHRVKRARR